MCFFISIVVGYANTSTTAKKYNCLGPAFITTGDANGKFTLKDFVMTGFNYEKDELRIIKPASSETAVVLSYLYESDDLGATGWWDMAEPKEYNDEPLALGTGFLSSYNSTGTIGVQNAGQVYDQAPTIDCRGNKYQVIPNPLPRRVKFSEVVVTGFNYEKDELRIIKADTSETDVALSYLYESDDLGATGWWDMATPDEYNDRYIEVGEGFLLSSNSGNVQITFPKAIK